MKTPTNSTGILSVIVALTTLTGCYYERSGATGWALNDSRNGGFERTKYYNQEQGPGLVFVEGGTFTMGQVDDDLDGNWDNIPRRATVSSFWMDETEVTNEFYNEYLFWLKRIYGEQGFTEVVERALPDTAAWRVKLGYNDPMVNYYLRHPAYRTYPVVGVSWLQAMEFCKWRTDRVNEGILIREGLIAHNPEAQSPKDHFTTQTYLNRQYDGEMLVDGVENFRGGGAGTKVGPFKIEKSVESYRAIQIQDGLLLPDYRLPTEAEWEFAALGLIGNSVGELVAEGKTYPWNGHYVRNSSTGPGYGNIAANFVKGRGDYMGVSGALDDRGDITVDVYAFSPNDYGLYNMAGNVNEWVMDVYRPLSIQDNNEFRPFRGNVYQQRSVDAKGRPVPKYSFVVYDLEEVKSFLTQFLREYAKQFPNGMPSEEEILINTVLENYVEKAIGEMENQRLQQASTLMADAMDKIEASRAICAPDLRKGISMCIIALPGEMQFEDESLEQNLYRMNYQSADNINYLDGDDNSTPPDFKALPGGANENRMYINANRGDKETFGGSTLISNRSRVYKGGGWDDRAYYLIPGTRRFLDERSSSASLGFRCAMDNLGAPIRERDY